MQRRHPASRALAFIFAISLPLGSSLLAQAEDLNYGEIYLKESAIRKTPFIYLSASYATDLSNSFLEMNSLASTLQMRLWKYISTGAFAHFIEAGLSGAGRELKKLENFDIHVHFSRPRWGLFSLTSLNVMLGQWNVFNVFPLRIDLVMGGGGGVLNRSKVYGGPSGYVPSYLWAVEQRMEVYRNFGISFGFFGHRGGTFIQTGLGASF